MKKILISFLVLLQGAVYAQNGLECIAVEKYYVSNANDTAENATGGVLPVGSVTYRIYADMLPGYNFQAAYGVDVAPTGLSAGDHELRIQTTTLFFNNQDRGATSPTFTKSRCADNTVMLDSWLSVGAACVGNFGIMKSLDNGVANVMNGDGVLQNNDATAGIALTVQDGLIAGTPGTLTEVGITNEILIFDNQNDGTNGPLFSTYNGSWACLGGTKGADTIDNKVLIAQLTTNGILTFELNIQIGTPTGGIERYVSRNPEGAEILLSCLIDTFGAPAVVIPLPVVNITSPANNSTFLAGQSIAINADASVTGGSITQVEFFVDGSSIGIDNNLPYTNPWTVVLGAHVLTAVATDNNGAKDTSSVVNVTGNPTGLNEISSAVSLNIFPNPTGNLFQLEISTTEKCNGAQYTVTDVLGNTLLQKKIGTITDKYSEQVDISSYASGIYFIQISSEIFSTKKPIIKN